MLFMESWYRAEEAHESQEGSNSNCSSVMDSWWFRFDTTKPRCLQNIVFWQKTLLGEYAMTCRVLELILDERALDSSSSSHIVMLSLQDDLVEVLHLALKMHRR
ncbi:hypothetical protein YC2023_092009 [Brassica napus]